MFKATSLGKHEIASGPHKQCNTVLLYDLEVVWSCIASKQPYFIHLLEYCNCLKGNKDLS